MCSMVMNNMLIPFSPRRLKYHQVLKKSGVGSRLPPMVTRMVMTRSGIAVFSDEKNLKTIFIDLVMNWLMVLRSGLVFHGYI